jgi:polysaccharide biosynthesis transport protein
LENHEEQRGFNLRGYWVRILRYRWLVGILAFTGWMLATTASWLLPPKYRSETVILVEQQKIPEHYVEPNVATDLQQRLQNMSEQILSRTRLLAIIDKFHLYASERSGTDPEGLVGRMRKNVTIELVRTPGTEALSAFKISYSDSSPTVAQQITRELTSLFIEENLRNRAQLSEDTTAFLENQLADARKSLDQQEQRLREFRSLNIGQLPEQAEGNLQILAGLQNQLQAATDNLHGSEQQRLFLQYQQRGLGGSVKSSESGQPLTVAGLDRKLDTLKDHLAELTVKYTPKHPDVVKIQTEIAATEALKARMMENLKRQKPGEDSGKETVGLGSDPSSSQLGPVEGQLKANELEIANQKSKIRGLESQIGEYRARLNRAPVREQQLTAITRDYEQSRTYYESLLAKKLQSEMATNLEKRRQSEQFRMIDPPNLPQKPYWPNRLIFSVAGLALGGVAGFGIIMLLEFANPRIYQDEELRAVEGVQLLVCVPTLLTPAERKRAPIKRLLESALASILLGVVSLGTLLSYYKG